MVGEELVSRVGAGANVAGGLISGLWRAFNPILTRCAGAFLHHCCDLRRQLWGFFADLERSWVGDQPEKVEAAAGPAFLAEQSMGSHESVVLG